MSPASEEPSRNGRSSQIESFWEAAWGGWCERSSCSWDKVMQKRTWKFEISLPRWYIVIVQHMPGVMKAVMPSRSLSCLTNAAEKTTKKAVRSKRPEFLQEKQTHRAKVNSAVQIVRRSILLCTHFHSKVLVNCLDDVHSHFPQGTCNDEYIQNCPHPVLAHHQFHSTKQTNSTCSTCIHFTYIPMFGVESAFFLKQAQGCPFSWTTKPHLWATDDKDSCPM